MNSLSRKLMIVASLILLATYFMPFWTITLAAPQYPEGIGIEIWLHTIKGHNTPYDLDKINNLNHYIGMKTIQPDAIRELDYMPVIIGFMILLGLAAAGLKKRWLIYAWIALFLIFGAIGLYDFYLWEYDYGHNLDVENAIIKVPGMNYQPPLIGSKNLLNFTATSLPSFGFLVIAVSMALATVAALRARRDTKSMPGGQK